MMNKIKEVLKKIGFSDKYGVIASIVIGVYCFACLAIFTFTSKDPIAYLGAGVGLQGTLIGFMFSKNRVENKAKIENWSDPNLAEDCTSTEDLKSDTSTQG